MKKSQSSSEVPNEPVYEKCPECCYHLDGRRMVDIDLNVIMYPVAGFQHHKWSTGNIYDKIGYATPCVCTAGRERQRRRESDREQSHYRSVRNGFKHRPGVVAGEYGRLIKLDDIKTYQARAADLERVTHGDFTDLP